MSLDRVLWVVEGNDECDTRLILCFALIGFDWVDWVDPSLDQCSGTFEWRPTIKWGTARTKPPPRIRSPTTVANCPDQRAFGSDGHQQTDRGKCCLVNLFVPFTVHRLNVFSFFGRPLICRGTSVATPFPTSKSNGTACRIFNPGTRCPTKGKWKCPP